MSVRKSHKSQLNSSGTPNCETNTSDVENINNFQNKDKTENSKTFDDGEMSFTDSEEKFFGEFSPVSSITSKSHYKSAKSNIKYTKQKNTYLEDSIGNNISYISPRISPLSMPSDNSEASDTDYEEPKQYNYSDVPSTSFEPDPYKNHKNIYSHKVFHTPPRHMSNKSNEQYNYSDVPSTSFEPDPYKNHKNIYSHKVFHTPPRHMSNKSNASRCVSTNLSTNGKKRVYTPRQRSQISFQNVANTLNACSTPVPFRKPNAAKNKNKQNVANTTKNQTQFEKYAPNETGFSEIMQSELCLKMFPVKTVPDLNCLKHDLMNVDINIRSNLIKRFNRNVCTLMKSKKDTDRCETDQSILSLIDIDRNIDFNSLDVLNNELAKLELVNKTLSTSKRTLNDKQKGKKSVNDLDGYDSDIDVEQCHRSGNSFGSLALPIERAPDESILDVTNAAENDSFDDIRELVSSNASLPFADNDIKSSSRSSDNLLIENKSLKRVDENDIIEFSAIGTPGQAVRRELCLNDSSVISELNPIHQDDGQDALRENRYNLRKRPRSTDHYFAPFGPRSLKAKKTRSNNYNKNMFFLGGTAKNKILCRCCTNSIELMKKLNPENDYNRSPKSKPCPCGIFPSQVPPSWNSSLHDCLHRNLHKLQFNCSEITRKDCIVNKCNSNGYIYNIIKITTSGDIDRDLESTLKNIKDFINTELDFSDNTIRQLNHAIYLAVNLDSKIIGYLEVESLNRACIYQNDKLSLDYAAVKFGVSKLWVIVSYRNNGVATRLLKQFFDEENLETKDIAFSYHRRHGMPFIKKFFADNSTLVY